MKTLTVNDINWSIFAQTDDLPVRGNALASGDDELDKKVEDQILNRLDDGDEWAWAMVLVQGEYHGLTASDTLGACTYNNQTDFEQNSGYYDDMQATIVDELNTKLAALCDAVNG